MTDLIGKPVVSAGSGERLGRAWDIRIRRENKSRSEIGGERWVVEAIVIRPRGALERFGFVQIRRTSPSGSWLSARGAIPWSRVERVGADAIVVTDA
jgi:sporulation protein YlmC with PRC-barrel domain